MHLRQPEDTERSTLGEPGRDAAPALPAGRIARLEAFRGIAAILVLWTHCLVVLPFIRQKPQSGLIFLQIMLMNGHLALMVFFVISGYVLGLSLDKGSGRPGNFREFFIRRVFRIYPAHVIALGVIVLVLSTFNHAVRPPRASPLFGALFSTPVTVPEVFLNALLVRVGLNGITWTLAVELAVSVVFPLLYLASRHSSIWVRVGMLLGLIGLSMFLGGTSVNRVATVTIVGGGPQGIRQPLLDILRNVALYGYVFYLGLVAEPFFKRLVPRLEGRWGTWLLWLALLVGLVGRLRLSLLVEVAGATVLVFGGVLMQTRNRITRALDHPFFVRLGTLSYSFYLYHLIVVYCIATLMFRTVYWLTGGFPVVFIWTLLALSFFVTRAVAVRSYRLIESPMISYSLRVCRRLRRPVVGVVPAVVPTAQPSD